MLDSLSCVNHCCHSVLEKQAQRIIYKTNLMKFCYIGENYIYIYSLSINYAYSV
jgi:hypothetical protein